MYILVSQAVSIIDSPRRPFAYEVIFTFSVANMQRTDLMFLKIDSCILKMHRLYRICCYYGESNSSQNVVLFILRAGTSPELHSVRPKQLAHCRGDSYLFCVYTFDFLQEYISLTLYLLFCITLPMHLIEQNVFLSPQKKSIKVCEYADYLLNYFIVTFFLKTLISFYFRFINFPKYKGTLNEWICISLHLCIYIVPMLVRCPIFRFVHFLHFIIFQSVYKTMLRSEKLL